MIQNELVIPSEANQFNIVAKSNQPLNNSGDTFGFIYTDDCGNDVETPIDGYEFTFTIYLNGCTYLTGGTLTGELTKGTGNDDNKLWFSIANLVLDRGVYHYDIVLTGSNSVIKGKLTVQ